mmetsp:Transcript_1803/g.2847  ORF Transcript_1803/g.2847 Transcript_1803/m.2847 type:complete len:170 (+) Transcript_1803:88-597(+)
MSKLGANNGNELIVGFSDRKRTSDTVGDDEETAATTMNKQVSFSEDVRIQCFQYPSREEVSKRWHNERNKYLFTQEMRRDVCSIRYLLSTTPMESLEKEVLYGCVGLEALVSGKVTRFVKDKRRGHARSIVEMQHYLGEEQLSAYAISRSSESRERAQQLAAGYSEILS